MGQIIANTVLVLLGVPFVISMWLFFLYQIDDVFLDGRYMDKIRAWNRKKRKQDEES